MPSDIEICNQALSHIGQGSINALDENSPQAEVCRLHYESTREACLREFPWNFARKSLILSQVDQTVPGWDYVYQYPSNVLWVPKVFELGNEDKEPPDEFEITSSGTEKFICTDVYQAYAKCTIKIADPNLFDPLFVEAFGYKLASKLTMPLTNSSNKTQEIIMKYRESIASAKLAGAVEGSAKKTQTQKPHSAKAYLVR